MYTELSPPLLLLIIWSSCIVGWFILRVMDLYFMFACALLSGRRTLTQHNIRKLHRMIPYADPHSYESTRSYISFWMISSYFIAPVTIVIQSVLTLISISSFIKEYSDLKIGKYRIFDRVGVYVFRIFGFREEKPDHE